MNIIYILLDQVRKDMLGAYGHQIVKTPNIDRLAKDGVRFNNAFTPASVCGPARTSLFTGLMPSTHGIIRNGEKGGTGEVSEAAPNIGKLDGYNTYVVGKWQGRRGSNSQHPVLETGALPIELRPYWY
jgi:arylsulfatase A-like enzyme